jgi:hypothetical protein
LQESGEGLRREQHPSKISETVVLFSKLLVLDTQIVGFLNLGGNLSFELANVFC